MTCPACGTPMVPVLYGMPGAEAIAAAAAGQAVLGGCLPSGPAWACPRCRPRRLRVEKLPEPDAALCWRVLRAGSQRLPRDVQGLHLLRWCQVCDSPFLVPPPQRSLTSCSAACDAVLATERAERKREGRRKGAMLGACRVCHCDFVVRRRTTLTCGDTCRKRLQRHPERYPDHAPPPVDPEHLAAARQVAYYGGSLTVLRLLRQADWRRRAWEQAPAAWLRAYLRREPEPELQRRGSYGWWRTKRLSRDSVPRAPDADGTPSGDAVPRKRPT